MDISTETLGLSVAEDQEMIIRIMRGFSKTYGKHTVDRGDINERSNTGTD